MVALLSLDGVPLETAIAGHRLIRVTTLVRVLIGMACPRCGTASHEGEK
jgi:hypothetical protein